MEADTSLLDQLKRGCPAAFETLLQQFEGPLYRFFLCDHRDHQIAQEQTAETFCQIVRSIATMRGDETQLRAFVFSIARHVRQRQWRKPKVRNVSLESATDICDTSPSPDRVASQREELTRVLDAIQELAQPVRTVLLLRFVEEMSIDEVAEALDMPVGTVKSHIHRGKTQLRNILIDGGCDP